MAYQSKVSISKEVLDINYNPEEKESLNSLKSQFWSLHASLEKDETKLDDNNSLKISKYEDLDKNRPSNAELIGYLNKHLPNSSSSYGGSLPLSAQSQNSHVLLRSSNCWKNTGYVLPQSNPSFNKVDQILKGSQSKALRNINDTDT